MHNFTRLDESKLSNASYSSTAARSLSMPVVDTCSLTEEKMKRLTLDHNSDQEEPKSIVYCTGKDVFHYHLTNSDNIIDRRSYKGNFRVTKGSIVIRINL